MRPAKSTSVPAYDAAGNPIVDPAKGPLMASGYYSWKEEPAGGSYVECGRTGKRQCNVQARPGQIAPEDLMLFRVPDAKGARGSLYDSDLEALATLLNETFLTWANIINRSRQAKGEGIFRTYSEPLEVTFLPTDTGLELVWDRPTGLDPYNDKQWRAAPEPDWTWP